MAGAPGAARGLFITLEGIDGVGKTTQLELLASYLRSLGRSVQLTEEPGGTPLGAALDRLLKERGPDQPTPRAEALLFLAARAQHVETVIQPALEAGRTVVCSRFSHSTLAYQCHGLGVDEPAVRAADAFARDGLMPDLVLVFEAADETVRERLSGRLADRIEARAADYQARVRDGFRHLAAEDPERVKRIDGTGDPVAIHARVREVLDPWL